MDGDLQKTFLALGQWLWLKSFTKHIYWHLYFSSEVPAHLPSLYLSLIFYEDSRFPFDHQCTLPISNMSKTYIIHEITFFFIFVVKHSRNPSGAQGDKIKKAIQDGDTETLARIILPMNKVTLLIHIDFTLYKQKLKKESFYFISFLTCQTEQQTVAEGSTKCLGAPPIILEILTIMLFFFISGTVSEVVFNVQEK